MRRWVGFEGDEVDEGLAGGDVDGLQWVNIWEQSIDMGHRYRTSLRQHQIFEIGAGSSVFTFDSIFPTTPAKLSLVLDR